MKITRLYVDNFRCLQNFELRPNQTTLLMGLNGSGKSSIRAALFRLRQMMDGSDVRTLFSADQLTAWDKREEHTFALDLDLDGRCFSYQVVIQHDIDRKFCKVIRESLKSDSLELFSYDGEYAQLFRDDGSLGPRMISDWHRSGISQMNTRRDNTLLSSFKEAVLGVVIVAIDPVRLTSRSESETCSPSSHFENFVDWLRWHHSEHQEEYYVLTESIQKVLPGFRVFQFDSAGEGIKECYLKFAGDGGEDIRIRFDRLSDGQRVLIVLYSLVAFAKYHPIVFLDEPQNFVSLQEIQPWLLDAMDRFEDIEGQLVICSHNSELVNLLARDHGTWLQRSPTGPTIATKPFTETKTTTTTLPPDEYIGRGWINE